MLTSHWLPLTSHKERRRKMRCVGRILLFSACAIWAQASVIVPNSLATVEGNGETITPFDEAVPIRYQQVYAASQFGSGGLITQIAFRPDGIDGHPFTFTLPDIEI